MSCIAGLFVVILGAVPFTAWQQVYDGGNTDKGHGICLDSANNIVIVGESNSGTDYDSWMIVVSKSGDSLWSKFYGDGNDESGIDVTITSEGAIAIAVNGEDVVNTILYDKIGSLLWERFSSRQSIKATAIHASKDDMIYTAGQYWFTPQDDFLFINGYDQEGQQVLSVGRDNGLNLIGGIQNDTLGYIYLGADQETPCALLKFDPDGELEWWKEYDNNATKGFGFKMNDAPHLFQSGDVATTGSNSDFLLLKWDTTGALIWPQHKAFDLGHNEYCRDIKLDDISDCYLAGWQVRGAEKDAALVKTDSAGRMLWSWVDTLEGDQEIEGIEVDSDGYIYLAGSHHNGANWDMLIMQVRQPLMITGRVTDSVGASMENIRVVLSGDTTIEVFTDTGGYYGIEVYNGGSYTVSPDLPGWGFLPSSYTYSPLAHREFNQNFSGEWTGALESMPSILPTLEVTGTSIRYTLPHNQQGVLSIYDASGQLIEEIEIKGSGRAEFDNNLPVGVYFVRVVAGIKSLSKKAVVLR